MSASAVAENAENSWEADANSSEAGPVAASSTTVPYDPMHMVSITDINGSARGSTSVGRANSNSALGLGICDAGSSTTAAASAVSANTLACLGRYAWPCMLWGFAVSFGVRLWNAGWPTTSTWEQQECKDMGHA